MPLLYLIRDRNEAKYTIAHNGTYDPASHDILQCYACHEIQSLMSQLLSNMKETITAPSQEDAINHFNRIYDDTMKNELWKYIRT